jgi:hypothetical protein
LLGLLPAIFALLLLAGPDDLPPGAISAGLPGGGPKPTVSPVIPADVEIPPGFQGDPTPFFDDYAWRAFIALNWPAADPDNSGTLAQREGSAPPLPYLQNPPPSRKGITVVKFQDIKNYLTAIAKKANGSIDDSPHGAFWDTDCQTFTTATVPGFNDVPILDKANPVQSPFFVILINKTGIPKVRKQMPAGGPFLTDPNYTATLADGTTVSGQKIIDDMKEWLSNGFPE